MDLDAKPVDEYIRETPLLAPRHMVPDDRALREARVAETLEATQETWAGRTPRTAQALPFTPDTDDQAAVVGSGLTAFGTGVSKELRYPLIHCLVFADMAANAADPDNANLDRWYAAYFGALVKLAQWVLGGPSTLNTFQTNDVNLTVHKAILQIVEDLLGGPATSAYALIKDALTGLESTEGQTPWFTLFRQHSQYANVGRCQVSAVTQDNTGLVNLSLATFGLEARSTLTQVLLFKFKSEQATLKWRGQTAMIDDQGVILNDPRIVARLAMEGVGPAGQGYVEEVLLAR